MGLRVQTQVSGNAFILHCEGRIVFGDLRERVGSLLSGTLSGESMTTATSPSVRVGPSRRCMVSIPTDR